MQHPHQTGPVCWFWNWSRLGYARASAQGWSGRACHPCSRCGAQGQHKGHAAQATWPDWFWVLTQVLKDILGPSLDHHQTQLVALACMQHMPFAGPRLSRPWCGADVCLRTDWPCMLRVVPRAHAFSALPYQPCTLALVQPNMAYRLAQQPLCSPRAR